MTPSAFSFSVASFAFPLASVFVACPITHSVVGVVWMAFRAVSFGFVFLAGISALLVYFFGDRFQMKRIYARSLAAFVVQFLSFRNRADVKFVADSVGAVNSFPDAELPVSPRSLASAVFDCDRSSPEPATRVGFGGNMRKKSFEDANLGFRHGMTLLWSACSGLHEAGNFVAARFYFTSNFHVNTRKGVL